MLNTLKASAWSAAHALGYDIHRSPDLRTVALASSLGTPRTGRHGFRPGQAGTAPRGARPLRAGPGRLRQQRPGLGQRRAAGRGDRGQRARRAAHPVARAPLGGKAPQRLLHDRARRGRGPDPHRHHGGARRGAVGDQRPQVVHLQRLGGRLPHRDVCHQPRRPSLCGLLHGPRPHRHARGRHRAGRADHGAPLPPLREVRGPLRDHLPRRARARREPRGQRG